MPNPGLGESRDKFVARCIPIVLADGTAKDQSQAAAICYSKYDEGKKSQAAIVLRKKTKKQKKTN